MTNTKSLFQNFLTIAKNKPNNIALFYEGKKITYNGLLKKVYRIASYYKQIGLKQDDLITLVAPNTPEAIAAFYAASMLNIKIHLLHPLTLENRIINEIKKAESKLLITVSLFLNNYPNILKLKLPILVLNPASSLNIIKKFGFNKINKKALETYRENKKIAKYDKIKKYYEKISKYNSKKGRIYLSSGGTSGEPKTIELSDYAILSLIEDAPSILNCKEEDIPNKIMLGALPMFHGFGLVMGILTLLSYGGKIFLLPKFHTKPVIKALNKKQLNILIGVPIMFEALLKNEKFNGKGLKNIEVAFVGGDFISPSLLTRFNTRLKENNSSGLLLEGYGLTETVTVLSVNTIANHKEGSVGKPLNSVKVKIVDEYNHVLPPFAKGEIVISSPTLMNRYVNSPSPFIKIDGDKYVKSGDLGYLDQDNYLYFISRIKRVIKKRGFNVFPLRIEKYISSLSYIDECAYLSKTNDKEEVTYMFIKPFNENDNLALESKIREEMKNNFETYEMPDKIIITRDFKKTNVGKIDYNYLLTLLD